MDEPEIGGMTINQVAELLGVHRRSVDNWIRRGVGGIKLRAWKVGRQWRTSREAIAEFQWDCTPDPPEIQRSRATPDDAKRRHGL